MKKLLILVVAFSLLTAGSALALSVTAATSPHNLSATGPAAYDHPAEDQVCIFCHTPHNATEIGTVTPLWNRTNPAAGGFTMYDSPTIDMTIAAGPQSISLACLSCHDGVGILDSYQGGANTGGDVITGSAVLGTVLTSDHPISITYDPLQDTAFNTAASVITAGVPLYGGSSDQVECGSCHNVHDYGDTAPLQPFMRISNAASALCITCHIK